MKKSTKAILILFLIIVVCLIVALWMYGYNLHGNRINDIDELYSKAKQYLIETQEESYISQDKNDVFSKGKDFQTFIDIEELGMNKKGDEIYVYVWALIENYYVNNENEVERGSGSSCPYRITFKNNEVINCEVPKDGAEYNNSLELLFPEYVRNILNLSLVDSEVISYQVDEHYKYLKEEKQNLSSPLSMTFYAEIIELDRELMLVKGLDVNDINHLGEFTFAVDEEIPIYWNYTPIEISDLNVKDTVSITYSGGIEDKSPARIANVSQIILLNHEKPEIKENLEDLKEAGNVLMEIVDETLTNTGAKIIITDNNEETYGYGAWYRIDKKVNGIWQEESTEVPYDEMAFIAIAYEVGEDRTLELEVDWESYYGELEKGEYRIVKKALRKNTDGEQEYIYADFEIK